MPRLRVADVDERMGATERFEVEPGKRYGDLTVISEAPHRPGQSRLWNVRCEKEKDGRPCGELDVRKTHQLKPPRMRACRKCCKAYQDKSRSDYGRKLFAKAGD